MKSDNYKETPRGPMTQSEIKRDYFTLITKAEFDKIFTDQKELNTGSQGTVFSANYSGEKVAIKYFHRASTGPDLIYYIQRQIESLDDIRHQNIVSLISTYQIVVSNSYKRFCIVTEYCESNLNQFKHIQKLSDIAKLRMCSEMMSGINAAHKKQIIHRDIKPENILIKDLSSFEIKIADFGCSKFKEDEVDQAQNLTHTNVGTPLFVDPNVKSGKYSFKCDVYSAGLVIACIFCGKHFFSDCKNEDQLNEAKKAFTKDIVVSTMQFLQQFSEQKVSSKVKTLLVDIAMFTMEDNEVHRFSADELLEYINNQLKNFQEQGDYAQIVQQNPRNQPKPEAPVPEARNQPKPEVPVPEAQNMKKKEFKSEFIEDNISSPNIADLKKHKTQDDQRFHTEERSHSEKSQLTMQTADKSDHYEFKRPQNSYEISKQDIPFEKHSNKSLSNNQQSFGEQSFDSPQKQYPKNDESPNKSQQNNQSSFISSDSNQFQQKWSKNEKPQVSSAKMFRNLKSSSAVFQTRGPGIKSSKSIEEESLRQSRIDQKQKTLSNTEKLCAELIRYSFQSSNINQEGEAMNRILGAFSSIRKNFEVVKRIGSVTESPLKKQYKVIIAFFFHFLYAGKMKDLRSFVLGQPSNLKLEYSKISSKRRETICTIVEKELQRIFDNLKKYSGDLKKIMDLIKPRLSDFTRNCIDDALRCTTPADWLAITYKQNEIKQEARKFIEEKQANIKNEQEMEIFKDLSKAIGRMCQ